VLKLRSAANWDNRLDLVTKRRSTGDLAVGATVSNVFALATAVLATFLAFDDAEDFESLPALRCAAIDAEVNEHKVYVVLDSPVERLRGAHHRTVAIECDGHVGLRLFRLFGEGAGVQIE
jgi:hypothetical protein